MRVRWRIALALHPELAILYNARRQGCAMKVTLPERIVTRLMAQMVGNCRYLLRHL